MSVNDEIRAGLIARLDEYIAYAGSAYRLSILLEMKREQEIYSIRKIGGLRRLVNVLEKCEKKINLHKKK
jgi:hypothetical protein